MAPIAVILFYGGWLTGRDVVTVGTLAAFVLYLQNLFEPIQQMSQLFNTIQAARRVAAEAVRPARRGRRRSTSDPAPSISRRPGALEVDDVSFRYGSGPPVLDARVAQSRGPGERLALVGPTGAGKSTLAKLMVRFYDPVDGSVRYGGVDLRDATLALAARAHRRGAAGRLPVRRHRSATTSSSRGPARPTPTSTAAIARARSRRSIRRVSPTARHRGTRARCELLGWGAPARLARPRRARRSRGRRARRGDVVARPRHRDCSSSTRSSG